MSHAARHLSFAEAGELVAPDGSQVSRRLYFDDDLYRLEQERVFGRCWLFLGHESQLPEPGSFFLSYMGEESVIVSRGRRGALRVHLNTCRHRGLRVCREDQGKTRAFSCPYHGWSYDADGHLVGVPDQAATFGDTDFDKRAMGLIPVAQVDSFCGLIFACFDAGAPSLAEYLGDMAFYLESSLDRRAGGIEVVGGIQKWRVDTNWKMPAENQVGDVAHGPISHASVFSMAGGLDSEAGAALAGVLAGKNVAVGNGHGLTVRLYGAHEAEASLPGETTFRDADPLVAEYFREVQAESAARLGPVKSRLKIATATVFPTFSLLGSNFTLRVSHPRGGGKSEIWSWVFVDREAPQVVKDAVRRFYTFTFGPAGIFEQDDGENWEEVTHGARGLHAQAYPFPMIAGLGRDKPHPELPGRISDVYSEHTQRAFYRRWRELMRTE